MPIFNHTPPTSYAAGYKKGVQDADDLRSFTVNQYYELITNDTAAVGIGTKYRITVNEDFENSDWERISGTLAHIKTSDGYCTALIVGITSFSKYLYIDTAPSYSINQGDTVYICGTMSAEELEAINQDIITQTERLETRLNGDSSESQTIYDKVFNDGVTEGRSREHTEFWDSFQNYGNLTDYIYAFSGRGWNNNTFKPKYAIKPTNCERMFFGSRISDDLTQLCELDTSNSTNMSFTFANMNYITTIGIVDCSKTDSVNALNYMFYGNNILITIEKLILPTKDINGSATGIFVFLHSLKNIIVEGVISFGGFDIHDSKQLTKSSITSIINALSSTTTGLTVTISLTAVNTAFETSEGLADGSTSEEWLALAATKSNWTISLIDS